MNGKKIMGLLIFMIFYIAFTTVYIWQSKSPKNISLRGNLSPKSLKNNSNWLNTTFPISSKYSILCTENLPYFTEFEQSQFWTKKSQKICEKSLKDEVKIQKQFITANCEDNKQKYFLQEDNKQEWFGGEYMKIEWKSVWRPAFKAEYTIVRCSNRYYPFVLNQFNKDLVDKAQQTQQSLGLKTQKPLTVIFLLFNSVSRGSAHRNWPSTMDFISSSIVKGKYSENFTFYDFKNSNAMGLESTNNLIPILYGHSSEYHSDFFSNSSIDDQSDWEKYLEFQEQSIWRFYSRLGYLTYFGSQNVNDRLVYSTGRKINADVVFLNFWKVANKVFEYSSWCLGYENKVHFAFEHAMQFVSNYEKENKFIYLQVDAGEYVEGVDGELNKFVKNVLERFDEQVEDLVVFLQSDMGEKNTSVAFDERVYSEIRSPLCLLIANNHFLTYNGFAEKLRGNTLRLVSGVDLNLSLKDLAMVPYEDNSKNWYISLKKDYKTKQSISIFSEIANKERTCSDIGIESMNCKCKGYTIVDQNNTLDQFVISSAMKLATKKFAKTSKEHSNCRVLKNFSILEAQKFEFLPFKDGWNTLYSVVFLDELLNQFKMIVGFSTGWKANLTDDLLAEEQHPFEFDYFGDIQICIQIRNMIFEYFCETSWCIC